MDTVVPCGRRSGIVAAPSSKSHAHRLLICAALGKTPVSVDCTDLSLDISATMRCLNALCARVSPSGDGKLLVEPAQLHPLQMPALPCAESGSTLRFLIPVCGALGKSVRFLTGGRLSRRPLHPLDDELRAHGMHLEWIGTELFVSGSLIPGSFEITGSVSSQFVSGLLFALPLLDGDSVLTVTGVIESEPYIRMTEDALRLSGIRFEKFNNVYHIPGNQTYALPASVAVEGDCSNAAFFLAMGALSEEGVTVENIPADTFQGDRKFLDVLRSFGAQVEENGSSVTVRKGQPRACTVDASDVPDLVPVTAVVAAAAQGDTQIIHASRLRLKESDRLASTSALLEDLGGSVEELSDGLIIHGSGSLQGGAVDSCNDHRIAMAAAVAASLCAGDVTVLGSECTAKSFPRFWEVLDGLEVLS